VYSGTGSAVFLWGAQLEQRSAVTAYTVTTTQPITNYIPVLQTAASGVARFEHNPITFESLGLEIEEQRTNLLIYSEEFNQVQWGSGDAGAATVTANTNISPGGTLTADTVDDTSASVVQGIKNGATITSGSGSYTASLFVKRNSSNCASMRITLSGGTVVVGELVLDTANGAAQWRTGVSGVSFSVTPCGNGWFRYTATITDNSSGNNNVALEIRPAFAATYTPTINAAATGSIFIWGAQLEAGAFPTSYIQTVASQVTRAADSASMTGTNFSSWYNQAEGTVYADWVKNGASNFQTVAAFSDNTSSNVITLSHGSGAPTNNARFDVNTAGVNQASIAIVSPSVVGTFYRTAGAYKVNDFAAVANAGTVQTDASGTLPVVNRLNVGMNGSSDGGYLNGTIRKIAYYPLRVTNGNLQALTS
jgi:hypothetical protein